MRDPGLEAELFSRDAFVQERELLLSSGQALQTTSPENCEIRFALAGGGLDPDDFDGLKILAHNQSGYPLSLGLRLYCVKDGVGPWFSGGRESIGPDKNTPVFLPWDSFGSYGQAGRLKRIVEIGVFLRREKGETRPETITFRVCGLWAVRRKPLVGPRLSPSGLGRLLVSGIAPTQAFKSCLETSVLKHVLQIPPPLLGYASGSVSDVLRGKIMGAHVGQPPDWRSDPCGELEWRHFLHRQHFLRLLAAKPKRRKCACILFETVTDWILRNPVPLGSDGGAGPGWETLSVAWRLREWIGAFGVFWDNPELNPETQILILRSVWEQARHLRDHRGHPGNWRLIEAASLSLTGLCFPGFREAPDWISLGLERLASEARGQFMADGAHCEASPLYHALCAQVCLETRLACALAKVAYPADLAAFEPGWFAALGAWQRPDGAWPSLNDSASSGRSYAALLRFARRQQTHDALSQWTTPKVFENAGIAILRNNKAWALFKAGPKPLSHGHDDDLSLEFCLGRQPVVVDPGITRYAPSPLTSGYRAAASHNCLTCAVHLGRAKQLEYVEEHGLRLARAEREGDGVWHARELCLHPKGALLVRDTLKVARHTSFRVNWQFSPGRIAIDASGLSVKGQGFGFAVLPGGLDLKLVRTRGDFQAGVGFVSLDGKDVAASHLSYMFSLSGEASFSWIFHPPGQVGLENGGLRIVFDQGRSVRFKPADWPFS